MIMIKLKKIIITSKVMIMIKLKKIIIMMMKINSLMANMITLIKMIKVIRMKMMIVKVLKWNNDHQFLLCFLNKFIFWRDLSKGLANVSFLTCFLQKDFCNNFVNILDIFSFSFFFSCFTFAFSLLSLSSEWYRFLEYSWFMSFFFLCFLYNMFFGFVCSTIQ